MKFNTVNTFFKYRKHALFIYVYIFSVEIVYSLLYLKRNDTSCDQKVYLLEL